MSSRSILTLVALALAAGSGGCASKSQTQVLDDSTGRSDAALIGATGNVMAWPAGPIEWNGLVGTWPIAIWAPTVIGALAFDVAGVTKLGVSSVVDRGLTPVTIAAPYLAAFAAAPAPPINWAVPVFGSAGLFAPAYGYAGVYAPYVGGAGYSFGAFTNFGSYKSTWLNGDVTPSFTIWSPSLTASALMFTSLAALDTTTPYTFNITFQAPSDAQAAALSNAALTIYATPVAPAALDGKTPVPFMTFAFPIMLQHEATPLL